MTEVLTRGIPSEHSARKANGWVREFFPESFSDDCEDKIGYTALIFYMSALDALGQSSLVHPEIMQGLQPDQEDDAAIYYALQKALAYQRENFPEG